MTRDIMVSGESKNIEYKLTLPDKSEKYIKTIVAFANSQGGKLIIGVDDKTHQVGGSSPSWRAINVEINGFNVLLFFVTSKIIGFLAVKFYKAGAMSLSHMIVRCSI